MQNTPLWQNTKVTELLKIKLPLIQAPMAGGATTPELIASVCEAGGLGSLAGGYLTADEIRKAINHIRQLTNKPFAVNLFIPQKHSATTEQMEEARKCVQASCHELNFTIPLIQPPYAPAFEEQMNVLLEENISIFSFAFGIPSSIWIEKFKHAGIKLLGTATSLEEAKQLEKCAVDAIVAQGLEAGGHRGTFLGKAEDSLTKALSLTKVLAENLKTPIITAGGIMEAKDIVAALTAGASAVQMGTAFLCCTESGIHPLYKKLLLEATKDNTTLTRAFSGKLARGIINPFIIRMQAHENTLLDYPIQNALTSAMRKQAIKQNRTDFMSLWAGQGGYLCKEIPAGQLIQALNKEVIALFKS